MNIRDIPDEFYIKKNSNLLRLAARLGMPRDLREKVVQESWLSAVEYTERHPGDHTEAELCALLNRIAHNKVVDACRYFATHPVASLEGLRIELMDHKSAAIAQAEEESEYLQSVLQKLRLRIGERDCWLLCAHYMEGRKHKELAKEADLSVHAVRNRVSRALMELQRLYFGDEDAP